MNKKLKNWFLNSGSSLDSDAQAFITAAAITDATQKTALNTLVIALKAAGLWTAINKAIWPILGGSASTHKWNLKDPRDLDAAYRLNIQGGWTHSATGMLPNGTTGYADTFFSPSVEFSSNLGALGFYSRTPGVSAGYDFSCTPVGESPIVCIIPRFTGDLFYPLVGSGAYVPSIANADGRGLFVATREVGFNQNVGYKNGSNVGSAVETTSFPIPTLYLGASNKGGSAAHFGSKECAFAFVTTNDLTAQNNAALYTAVQAYQTTLGRQV